ncbi:MAG: phosphohistidine phosphatase SixA [Proteobacteria bacterium]|nr:phosphohistidine phosphatase SixA [Pseudomonadota bacterium]
MFLYLVQHGEAKSKEEDPLRPLSDEGGKLVEKTAKYLGKLKPNINKIIHSGKLRAEQTARSISVELSPKLTISQEDYLSPNDDPNIWADRLKKSETDIMIVGHLPYLSRLTSLLLCGDGKIDLITFKNAGAVCLKREESGEWSLIWILIPEMIL